MTVRPVPVLGEDRTQDRACGCAGPVRFGYRSTLGAGVAVARSTLHSAIVYCTKIPPPFRQVTIVLPTGSHVDVVSHAYRAERRPEATSRAHATSSRVRKSRHRF